MSGQNGIPESRNYIHDLCGEVTEVGAGDFKNMAAPVPGMLQTICSRCGRAFPVSDFHWEDTGENIVTYYDRHRAKTSAFVRMLCSRKISVLVLCLGILGGLAIGVWCGNSLGLVWGVLIGFLATLVCGISALVIWDGCTNWIVSRALGVDDVRCLK